jgi:branched-chain amino acid transport system substrate-binding protein
MEFKVSVAKNAGGFYREEDRKMEEKEKGLGGRMTRRDFLKTASIFSLAATLGGTKDFFLPTWAQGAEPVKIGHLVPLTGFLAMTGTYGDMGARLAVEEVNKKGGVLGRPLEMITEDEVNPGIAVQKTRKLIDKDRVQGVFGTVSSASALAMSDVCQQNRLLFINSGSNSDEIRGSRCHRYTFCIEGSNTQYVSAIGQWLIKKQKLNRWYVLTADYAFGHDLSRASKRLLTEHGGTEIANDLIPTGSTDFSNYLNKIRNAKPDLVFLNLAGADITNCLKQYKEFGLPFEVSGGVMDTAQAWAVGPDAMTGVYPLIWYHKLEFPGVKEFVNGFVGKFGKPPENQAWGDYVAVKVIAAIMDKAKSTDSKVLVKALEDFHFDAMKGRSCYFRDWDHQLMEPMFVVRPKKKREMKDQWDIWQVVEEVPVKKDPLETIALAKKDSQCNLEPLD